MLAHNTLRTLLFVLSFGLVATAQGAGIMKGDAAAGEGKAVTCSACHGADGKATVESWPNLNCQNRGYLYSRLMNLKRDSDHDINDKVKSLSITEIDEISRYYSEQKCSVPLR